MSVPQPHPADGPFSRAAASAPTQHAHTHGPHGHTHGQQHPQSSPMLPNHPHAHTHAQAPVYFHYPPPNSATSQGFNLGQVTPTFAPLRPGTAGSDRDPSSRGHGHAHGHGHSHGGQNNGVNQDVLSQSSHAHSSHSRSHSHSSHPGQGHLQRRMTYQPPPSDPMVEHDRRHSLAGMTQPRSATFPDPAQSQAGQGGQGYAGIDLPPAHSHDGPSNIGRPPSSSGKSSKKRQRMDSTSQAQQDPAGWAPHPTSTSTSAPRLSFSNGNGNSAPADTAPRFPAVLTREKKQKACANCRKAKLKCIVETGESVCVRCEARKEKCVFYPRAQDEDFNQTVCTDLYAATAHLAQLSAAVNHILTHLVSSNVIPPFTPGLDKYEAPDREPVAPGERNSSRGEEGDEKEKAGKRRKSGEGVYVAEENGDDSGDGEGGQHGMSSMSDGIHAEGKTSRPPLPSVPPPPFTHPNHPAGPHRPTSLPSISPIQPHDHTQLPPIREQPGSGPTVTPPNRLFTQPFPPPSHMSHQQQGGNGGPLSAGGHLEPTSAGLPHPQAHGEPTPPQSLRGTTPSSRISASPVLPMLQSPNQGYQNQQQQSQGVQGAGYHSQPAHPQGGSHSYDHASSYGQGHGRPTRGQDYSASRGHRHLTSSMRDEPPPAPQELALLGEYEDEHGMLVVLGSKDPRQDVIKKNIVSSIDALMLVNYFHNQLSGFLYGYRLQFRNFPYLGGGPTTITPLILAVLCLISCERFSQFHHYRGPLVDEVLALLETSPAESWQRFEGKHAADFGDVEGDEPLDAEFGLGPEEIVAACVLATYRTERREGALIARSAFRWARGWIRLLSSTPPRVTLAETAGFVPPERQATPQDMARIWLLCYIVDSTERLQFEDIPPPLSRDAISYCNILLPPPPIAPASSSPTALTYGADPHDVLLTWHARLITILNEWRHRLDQNASAGAGGGVGMGGGGQVAQLKRLAAKINGDLEWWNAGYQAVKPVGVGSGGGSTSSTMGGMGGLGLGMDGMGPMGGVGAGAMGTMPDIPNGSAPGSARLMKWGYTELTWLFVKMSVNSAVWKALSAQIGTPRSQARGTFPLTSSSGSHPHAPPTTSSDHKLLNASLSMVIDCALETLELCARWIPREEVTNFSPTYMYFITLAGSEIMLAMGEGGEGVEALVGLDEVVALLRTVAEALFMGELHELHVARTTASVLYSYIEQLQRMQMGTA